MNREENRTYEKELSIIDAVFGVGRKNRMGDLVGLKDDWNGNQGKALAPESMEQFMAFVARFGKVADDLALFLNDHGHLIVSWSYWVNDPARQRRGGLTRRVNLEFAPAAVLYSRYGIDEKAVAVAPDSDELRELVEAYRSHRPL